MEKLKDVAKHLLDLGKRNRLLNYKDTGNKSLTIFNSNLGEVFLDIIDSKWYGFFPTDEVVEKRKAAIIKSGGKIDESIYGYDYIAQICEPLIKKNQVLSYKKDSTLKHVLKSLMKDYKLSLSEKGINSLYMSFGFLKYFEGNDSYSAPILLIPLNMKYENNLYKIHEYEDEVVVNPTLNYYLETNFKTKMPTYTEPTPLEEYLEELKKVLPKGFEVEFRGSIGIYSFLKMNMYYDLINNESEVLKNKQAYALLSGVYDSKIDGQRRCYPVVNADSSQLEAISMATNGSSFVLQGPPGSGKSQTITNIISSLIANNKKVLFVSEKRAALQVVYENLRRAKLDEFVVELHSNKANKKEFIDALFKASEDKNLVISNKALAKYNDIEVLGANLNDYHNALNKNTKYGISAYSLYKEYCSILEEDINYRLTNIENLDFSQLNEIINLLETYITYSKRCGYNYKSSPFYGIKINDSNYIRYDFEDDVTGAIKYLTKLLELKEGLYSKLNIAVSSVDDVYKKLDFIDTLFNLKFYFDGLVNGKNIDNLLSIICEYNNIKNDLDEDILKQYNKKVLSLNLEDTLFEYKKYSSSIFSRLFNKNFKELSSTLLAYRSKKANYKVIISDLERLHNYKLSVDRLNEIETQISSFVEVKPIEYDKFSKELNEVKRHNMNLNLSVQKYNEVKNFFLDFLIYFQSNNNLGDALNRVIGVFNPQIRDFMSSDLSSTITLFEQMLKVKGQLNDYIYVSNTILELNKYSQLDYLDFFIENEYDIEKLAILYKKAFYLSKIYEVIDSDAILSGFSSFNMVSNLEKFKNLDEEIYTINRDYALSVNYANRPKDLLEGSMFKILAYEHNKSKKQKPIRMLLNEIFPLALDLKPVFLMSPLSISTYLDGQCDMFDCVIFDEASQIFSWDSIGAIYRAKQCIIIGDAKQMPPSAFFNTLAENDDDDYNNPTESILDKASLVYPSTRLKWHYRSRSEELIAFSNKEFYESGLITIPQAKKHEIGFGVDFIYVKDGIYSQKLATNIREAEVICDMVFDHFDKDTKSLGVVAFSNAQATLIEELVEKRRLEHPEYEKFFSDEVDEPFFIKNLETVQGDERDRIIFSICYGYNSEGKFYQRFGPLNNDGGEKRLNVAITRAKYNVTVVSSIIPQDIKDQNTESIGVKLLKKYLEYAKSCEASTNYEDSDDGVINGVIKYINTLGYEAYSNYGTSSFKIDIVVKSMNSDNLFLAIMLDKEHKYSKNNTEKFRLEESLLNRLGFKYFKLYSTSWINNKESEIERLKEALKEEIIEKETPLIDESEEKSYLVIDTKDKSLESNFDTYKELAYSEGSALAISNVDKLIKKLLLIEGPIHIDYLYKRVAFFMDKPKVTSVVKNTVNSSLDLLDALKEGDFYYLDDPYGIKLRLSSPRNIEQIYKKELEHGIMVIVENNNGITIKGCYKALLKLLGYERITETTKAILDDILVYMKLDGKIMEKNECLFK